MEDQRIILDWEGWPLNYNTNPDLCPPPDEFLRTILSQKSIEEWVDLICPKRKPFDATPTPAP